MIFREETDIMSKTRLDIVENGKEKACTYKYQMERYKLSIGEEFYFEAIVITYAMIEDRLLAILHYLGVIDRRIQTNQTDKKIYVCGQCKKQINELLKCKNNNRINLNTIEIKIKIIQKLMNLHEESGDLYLDLVRTQINKTINRDDFNALLQNLNTWKLTRNQIIHALMGKRTKDVLTHQTAIAKEGYKIGRKLDSFVSKLKKENKNGIRIPENNT